MAVFFNKATLSYNDNVTDSNVVSGEILEVLSATKSAITDNYNSDDTVTYVISIINSGVSAITGLSVTDDLGAYPFGMGEVVPLSYVVGSVQYYSNGVLQATPVTVAGPPLIITGIAVPANGNVTLIYQAEVNQFAPLAQGATITNTAIISGGGLTDVVVSDTVTVAQEAMLTISKSLSPETVVENGQITYTFIIQNSGNEAAVATDNVTLTDTFNPILDPISVTFNGVNWTEGVNYNYNTVTGVFTTVPGQITVPAATFTQDPVTGRWAVSPGVSVLRVVGTV